MKTELIEVHCKRCEGTGNELLRHYKYCTDCGGIGHHLQPICAALWLAAGQPAFWCTLVKGHEGEHHDEKQEATWPNPRT